MVEVRSHIVRVSPNSAIFGKPLCAFIGHVVAGPGRHESQFLGALHSAPGDQFETFLLPGATGILAMNVGYGTPKPARSIGCSRPKRPAKSAARLTPSKCHNLCVGDEF